MRYPTRLGLVLGFLVGAVVGPVAAQATGGAAPSSALIAKGDTVFHKTGLCYACHGTNAEGTVGPNLTDGEWIHGDGSIEMIVATVTSGIPKEKSQSGIVMPPKGGSSISEEDITAVAAYVYSLSHKGS
jgi:cbb3-type cytochrome c oxidase subunit III